MSNTSETFFIFNIHHHDLQDLQQPELPDWSQLFEKSNTCETFFIFNIHHHHLQDSVTARATGLVTAL